MQAPGRSRLPDSGGIETRRQGEVHPARTSLDTAPLVGQAPAGILPGRADGPAAARPLRPPLPRGVQDQSKRTAPCNVGRAPGVGLTGPDRRRTPSGPAQVHRRICQLGQLGQGRVLGNRTRVGQGCPSRTDASCGGPLRRRRLHTPGSPAAGLRCLRQRPQPRCLPDPQGHVGGHPTAGGWARRRDPEGWGGDQSPSREEPSRPVPQGPGRSNDHSLSLGTDGALRGPKLWS